MNDPKNGPRAAVRGDMDSRGVLYYASGSSYIEEAKISARSLKRHNPSLPVTLYTDGDVDAAVFDRVVKTGPVETFGDNILSAKHFPYARNLYLDSDTFVCGDISGVFDVLDEFDLAISHDICRGIYNVERGIYDDIDDDPPGAFPEYNTGVMAYNRCAKMKDFFERWDEKHDEYEHSRNQPAFKLALYDSDLRLTTLTKEYNFRVDRVGYACGAVKILHKGASDMDASELAEFGELVNSRAEERVITWDDHPCRVAPQSHHGMRYEIKRQGDEARKIRKQNGSLSLLNAAVKKLGGSSLLPDHIRPTQKDD